MLYALGGASGGLTLYMDKGILVYEYNMMIIEDYEPLGRRNSCGEASHRGCDHASVTQADFAGRCVVTVDGKEVAR